MHSTGPRISLTRLLALFCVLYPLWVVGVGSIMKATYFNPLCRTYASTYKLEFRHFARGGRSSPPSCVMNGKTIPIREIGGTTAHMMYIVTDIVAILLPFLVIFLL